MTGVALVQRITGEFEVLPYALAKGLEDKKYAKILLRADTLRELCEKAEEAPEYARDWLKSRCFTYGFEGFHNETCTAEGFTITTEKWVLDHEYAVVVRIRKGDVEFERLFPAIDYAEWKRLDEFLKGWRPPEKRRFEAVRERIIAVIGYFPAMTRMLIHALTKIPPKTVGTWLSKLHKEKYIRPILLPAKTYTVYKIVREPKIRFVPLRVAVKEWYRKTTALGEKAWSLTPKGLAEFERIKRLMPKPLVASPL